MRKFYSIVLASVILSCNSAENDTVLFYSASDFPKVEKIDAHVHINTSDTLLPALARENNFRLVNINVAAPGYPTLFAQQAFARKHLVNSPGVVSFITSFDMSNFNDSSWQTQTLHYLDSSFNNGAVGVKVWKNIGMELRDAEGKFIMIDHPRFDTVFSFIESRDKMLVAHIGEPKNCWLPLEEMTVKNDRDYFRENPGYHMYLHPEFPSYLDQVNARNNVLQKHPGLRVVGAHLGSIEWSVAALAARLDSFPNFSVDLAARISHLQYQSISNREKVIDFFEKYQDRLIYATDLVINDNTDKEQFKITCSETWKNHWRFFVTDDILTAKELEETFRGLHLSRAIVDKIYRINARKAFKGVLF